MNATPNSIRRLLRTLGIDRAVAYALMTHGWGLLTQPITVFLIAEFLSPNEVGYFAAFGSIIGLQMFFDLGLGAATLQSISHEAGHLHWTADGTLAGDPRTKSRLASLFRQSCYWYGTIAAVLLVILLPAGWIFFSLHDEGIAWRWPWVWTALIAMNGLLTIPPIVLLAGCGRVADTNRATAIQRVASSGSQWLALAAGGALLSWPAAQTVGLGFLAMWLLRSWGPAFRDLFRQPTDGPRVDWRREVWPFQWRMAVSAPFGYLTSYLFNLVLFDDPAYGTVVAGHMGMSLMVMNSLISATIAWLGTRMPVFGHLIARRDWASLDRLFRHVFISSTLLSVVGAVAGFGVLVLLRAFGYKLGMSMLPPVGLALLLANAVVQHMVHALAAYLRAHKRDPFYGLFIGFGLAMAAAVFTVGRWYGPTGMAASLLVLNTTICLGGGSILFIHCRRIWHADSAIIDTPSV